MGADGDWAPQETTAQVCCQGPESVVGGTRSHNEVRLRVRRKSKRTNERKRNNVKGALIRQENANPAHWPTMYGKRAGKDGEDISGGSLILLRVRKNLEETFNLV